MKNLGLDENGLPNQEGVYLVKGIFNSDEINKIDVYAFKEKGLCCFRYDYGGGSTGVNDETDDHISVQMTGLEFIKRDGDLD